MMSYTLVTALLLCNLSWIPVSVSESQTVEVQPGGEVTLMCTNISSYSIYSEWFRVGKRSKPCCISSMYKSDDNARFCDGFQNGNGCSAGIAMPLKSAACLMMSGKSRRSPLAAGMWLADWSGEGEDRSSGAPCRGGEGESRNCGAPPSRSGSRSPDGEMGELGGEPEMEGAEPADSCPPSRISSRIFGKLLPQRILSSSSSGETAPRSAQLPSPLPSTWSAMKASAHRCSSSTEKPDGITSLASVILGGVTVFLLTVIVSLVLKIRQLQTAAEEELQPQRSEVNPIIRFTFIYELKYAALSFHPKPKRSRRPASEKEVEPNVVYAATR
ncbi:uncharacterized protein LOC144543545 [Centroberyx gerrardi]